jgi:ATP-dependent DNA helicase DinG
MDKFPLPKSFPADIRELEYILQAGGPLALRWKEFEPRAEQITMFKEVARAFKTGDISLIEAGTGTGKTLAYLLPALISGKKTIISTGLKNLQEQILHKELKTIRKYFDVDFKAVILKGRENYLCLRNFHVLKKRFSMTWTMNDTRRYNAELQSPTPGGVGDKSPRLDRIIENGFVLGAPDGESYEKFRIIENWQKKTDTGELSELPGNFFKSVPFNFLRSTSDDCQGKRCPQYESCHLNRVRQKAGEANIVLVNHHLLLADLTLRDQGFSILPEWEAAVIDEAHLLERTATKYFSHRCSAKEILDSVKDYYDFICGLQRGLSEKLGKEEAKKFQIVIEMLETVKDSSYRILNNFQSVRGERRLWPNLPEEQWEDIIKRAKFELMNLYPDLCVASNTASIFSKDQEDMRFISRKLKTYTESLKFILDYSDPSYVYQMKGTPDDCSFEAIPILVSPYLSEALFQQQKTIILTSATMSVNNKLDYFRNRLGIDERAEALIFPSPYDFKNNTILYLPTHLPIPNRYPEEFAEAATLEIEKILEITRGRALVLFTSFVQMNRIHAALKPKVKYTLYKQGEHYSRGPLLERFAKETNSVLFATMSFWQGIDVPGPSLSAVIIDKIPFPQKNLPVTEAKEDFIRSQKGSPFYDFYIPEATILLKQGLGRLLRTKTDKGLLAVLDARLTRSHYGPRILSNLPPSVRCDKLEEVEAFFKKNNI